MLLDGGGQGSCLPLQQMSNDWTQQKANEKKSIRAKLVERDGSRRGSRKSPFGKGNSGWVQCHYCQQWTRLRGKTPHDHANIAHIIPDCYGGPYTVENLVFACFACNQADSLKYNYLGCHLLGQLALPAPPVRLALQAPKD